MKTILFIYIMKPRAVDKSTLPLTMVIIKYIIRQASLASPHQSSPRCTPPMIHFFVLYNQHSLLWQTL